MIQFLVGPALVVGAISFAQFLKAFSGKRIAILGAEQSGKTSLLMHLRDQRSRTSLVGEGDVQTGGRFSLQLGKKSVDFELPKDLSGSDGGASPAWREAFAKAHFVLYLFRADLLIQGDTASLSTIKTHFDTFKIWLDDEKFNRPKIILVATFADNLAPSDGRGEARTLVAGTNLIKLGRVKLNNAGLVVGALDTPQSRSRLVYDITACMQ